MPCAVPSYLVTGGGALMVVCTSHWPTKRLARLRRREQWCRLRDLRLEDGAKDLLPAGARLGHGHA